jgi:hypothetical protein
VSSDLVELKVRDRFSLLPSGPGDRFFDYCLQPYQPRRPPTGKLRAENVFRRALQAMGCLDAFGQPIAALQQALGRDMTVWGIKHDGTSTWCELYVYDPRKEEPAATLGALRETLAPWARILPEVRESVPYMMVSFDLFADTFDRGEVPEVNLYLTGTPEHEGRSYRVTATSRELENTYCFMEPKRDIDRLLSLLRSSLFVDYGDPRVLSRVLVPELFACKRVCVAKKRHRDGIYFSGIDVDQLLWFLRALAYPATITSFVAQHRGGFEHLYFDVGIDYEQHPDGSIAYTKSSFYGTF